MTLLEVNDLSVTFYTEEGAVRAVDGLSYRIERGETFGVVGESGAGKSVAARSVLGLVDAPGRIEGEILFDGENLLELTEGELRRRRGAEIAMAFQDAQAALNPVYAVGEQIAEAIRHHLEYDEAAARDRAVRLLDRVGIPSAETRYDDYPHEFSAGMQRRVVVAMALSCEPDLLICDEPTSGLDVTIQAQLLEELESIAEEFGTTIQFISHDLGVVAQVCDRVMVMYAGTAVETAPVEELYYDPKHPYTVGLLSAIPRVGDDRERLPTVPGTMPDPTNLPPGCRFHPRCPYAEPCCARTEPRPVDPGTGEPATHETSRAAACLEYTGDLREGLDYEVIVEERTAGAESDGDAAETDESDPEDVANECAPEDVGDGPDPEGEAHPPARDRDG